MVLMFFYKTEELKVKRLRELYQYIVHAIAGWYLSYIYLFYNTIQYNLFHVGNVGGGYPVSRA